jgi:transposase
MESLIKSLLGNDQESIMDDLKILAINSEKLKAKEEKVKELIDDMMKYQKEIVKKERSCKEMAQKLENGTLMKEHLENILEEKKSQVETLERKITIQENDIKELNGKKMTPDTKSLQRSSTLEFSCFDILRQSNLP